MKKNVLVKCHSIDIEGPLFVDFKDFININDYFGRAYNTECFRVSLIVFSENMITAKPIIRHFFSNSHSLIFKKCEEFTTLKLIMSPVTITLPFGKINRETMNNKFNTLKLQDERDHDVAIFEMYMQDKLFYNIPH